MNPALGDADGGETLVEVLVTIIIMGIAAAAILAGLQLSLQASSIERKEATSGAYVRNYAEAIEGYLATSTNYKPCAGANYYSPALIGFSVPSGYTATQTAATVWNGSGWGACSVASDVGAQRVTLTIASTDVSTGQGASETLTVVLRKSCAETATSSSC